MQSYQRYPLIMHHPAAMPAVTSDARDVTGFRPAQAARFQPVTVHNADQEAQHRAQGYKPINEPAEDEFVRVQAAAVPFGHAAAEWPKMVDGRLVEDPDNPRQVGPVEYPKWVNGRIVQNRDEEMELLGQSEPASEGTEAEPEADGGSQKGRARGRARGRAAKADDKEPSADAEE